MVETTKPMRFALCTAAHRPRGTVCPVVTGKGKLSAAAEDVMLAALHRRGLIEYVGPIPVISPAGQAVVDATFDSLSRTPAV